MMMIVVPSLSSEAFLGAISGVTAQVVASPADLVKVRMQADSRMVSQGHQPRYLGPFNAFSKIVQAEGFGGLWKGVFPNIQRAFLVNMGELACYDHAKQFFIQNQIAADNIYAHTLASIMSGLAATALSCPADVIKTRMMNQVTNKEGQITYKNSYDCLVKTVRIEGLRALWKGFFLHGQDLVLGNLCFGSLTRSSDKLQDFLPSDHGSMKSVCQFPLANYTLFSVLEMDESLPHGSN